MYRFGVFIAVAVGRARCVARRRFAHAELSPAVGLCRSTGQFFTLAVPDGEGERDDDEDRTDSARAASRSTRSYRRRAGTADVKSTGSGEETRSSR